MSLIKPTITEALFHQFFHLDSTRMDYYRQLINLGRTIFLNLGLEDKAKELKQLVWKQIEYPFMADFSAICTSFYHPRFMMSKKAYTLIQIDGVHHKVTRFEMERRFEIIKEWITDHVVELSQHIRFTRPSEIYN